MICKLKKSPYDLKQAPRQQYLKFDRFMVSSGFTRLHVDHCYYSKWFENSYIILLVYIDGMRIVGSCIKKIVNIKTKSTKELSMKNLVPAKKILEIRISREKKIVEDITNRVRGEGAEEV